MTPVRVLVVEDEEVALDAHATYVGRLEGFELVGTARSGRDAVRVVAEAGRLDLILLDLHLPDTHGLALIPHLRAAGVEADVIAVTSARDVEVVRRAVGLGVAGYLLKPFTFASFRSRLEQYAAARRELAERTDPAGQDEVDELLAALRPRGEDHPLPKGMSAPTLAAVRSALRERSTASASEVAALVGASRVTARRYLEHLADTRVADRENRLGGTGRPEVEYRWRG